MNKSLRDIISDLNKQKLVEHRRDSKFVPVPLLLYRGNFGMVFDILRPGDTERGQDADLSVASHLSESEAQPRLWKTPTINEDIILSDLLDLIDKDPDCFAASASPNDNSTQDRAECVEEMFKTLTPSGIKRVLRSCMYMPVTECDLVCMARANNFSCQSRKKLIRLGIIATHKDVVIDTKRRKIIDGRLAECQTLLNSPGLSDDQFSCVWNSSRIYINAEKQIQHILGSGTATSPSRTITDYIKARTTACINQRDINAVISIFEAYQMIKILLRLTSLFISYQNSLVKKMLADYSIWNASQSIRTDAHVVHNTAWVSTKPPKCRIKRKFMQDITTVTTESAMSLCDRASKRIRGF
jgi:hypothetical protein